MGHGFYGPFGGFGFMPGFGGVFNILFGLLIVYFIFRFFLHRGGTGCCGSHAYYRNSRWPQEHHPDSVEEILRQRYAKGELSREQYQQIKEDLK